MARKPSSPPAPQDMSIEEALKSAYAHWNAGHADQAEFFCQRVLAAWPGQTDAAHLLGVMAHAYGNLDLAIQHLRQACSAPRAPAVYFSNLAEMCRQKGLLAEAEQAGRRAVALDQALVAAWNNLGIILQEAGKLEESQNCLEQVVRLQPNYPEAHNNLGNTFKRLGRLDRAGVHYAKALELHPNYAEAHSNYANLQHDLGHLVEAAATARRAIELNPQLADAYINLAAIEESRNLPAETLRWLDALLSFAPLHSGGLAARAMALKQLDRLEEAVATARRAVEAQPENAEAFNILGKVLHATGQFDEALSAFAKAADLPGVAREQALVNQALLFMETGRKEKAGEIFNQVLDSFPKSVSARFNQSDMKTYRISDPDIVKMESLLSDPGLQSYNDRMYLHFTLGKAYLDGGNGDRAFHHLNEGNRMKRQTFTFDSADTARWLAQIADSFTPAVMKKFKGAGSSSSLPVFVIGIPRSGTTLVEQILASHPQVHGGGELSCLQRLVGSIPCYPVDVKGLSKEEVSQLGQSYLAQVEPLALGRRYLVDKMPANFLHVGLIRLILPEARIIHCRRDPVDTCLSCYSKLFTAEQKFAYDLTEIGEFHRGYQTLMAHWRKIVPKDRFIEVDYEAVVDDLEGQARRLVDFLGLPWDDACLEFYKTRRVVRTASANQVTQPIYTSSKGRWKPYADQLKPLLAALGIEG